MYYFFNYIYICICRYNLEDRSSNLEPEIFEGHLGVATCAAVHLGLGCLPAACQEQARKDLAHDVGAVVQAQLQAVNAAPPDHNEELCFWQLGPQSNPRTTKKKSNFNASKHSQNDEKDTATSLESGKKMAELLKKSTFTSYDGDHYFFAQHAKNISEKIENGIL